MPGHVIGRPIIGRLRPNQFQTGWLLVINQTVCHSGRVCTLRTLILVVWALLFTLRTYVGLHDATHVAA